MKEAPPLVCVEWEDASVLDTGPWALMPDEIKHEPRIFMHVGFLLADLPEGIQLTEAWSEEVIAPRTQIPRGMIRRLVYLGPIKRRR